MTRRLFLSLALAGIAGVVRSTSGQAVDDDLPGGLEQDRIYVVDGWVLKGSDMEPALIKNYLRYTA